MALITWLSTKYLIIRQVVKAGKEKSYPKNSLPLIMKKIFAPHK